MASGGNEGPREPVGADKQVQAKAVDPVAGKTVAEILGEIVWLMTQDQTGRDMKVSEIERLVMPAILQRQFHITYAQVPDMRKPGAMTLQPVAVEIFAPPNGGNTLPVPVLRFSLLLAPMEKSPWTAAVKSRESGAEPASSGNL